MLGDELIWSSNDAAVSSSGVHDGDTEGEAVLDMRRGGIERRIEDSDGGDCGGDVLLVREGCAGPGSINAGSGWEGCAIGGRKEPDSGGVGSVEPGSDSGRQLGST